MSSDNYFDDDFDSAFLNAVDAIEASHASPLESRAIPSRPHMALAPQVIEVQDSDEDYDTSGFNDDALKVFDQLCAAQEAAAGSRVLTSAQPTSRKPSMGTVQTNLFGQIVPNTSLNKAGLSSSRKPMSRTSSSTRNSRSQKTKQWDHMAFAKYGWKKPKGKEKASFDGEEEEEEVVEDNVEFEQFPNPSADINPPPPLKLKPDLLAAKRWLYPLNKPKRDYQFNIVKKCLFQNTLVAIPTGLGKTFIAGVVMLNFYTWFPEGKVVFVAPTRPLVAQQIEACHQTCGIPGRHAVELTGQNSRLVRARAWQEKRVFYMTPQTLMNDIRNEVCDCRDIVLVVVDEAHKGTGDYAYAQVVRYLMAKSPHFRLLALTATPGSTPEAVQAVVDSLHISHVEIRDEESLDLRRYMHEKRVDQHIIHMNEDIMKIADLLEAIMHPLLKLLQSASIIRGYVDAKTLHPYRCQVAMAELTSRRDKHPWAYKPLSQLGALARAMGYLYEGSMSMCYNSIKSQFDDDKNPSKKQQSKIQQDPKFQSLMKELETQRARSFTMHPKKEKMLDLIIQHFGSKMSDENGREISGSDASRVMVFSSFRENVDELVDMLDNHKPLIRAVRFIGQGTDKQGRKGYAQKEQMEVIKKFKAGEYNVLVSTSVGEEGLDIGEVDMIICYESQKTPIRMLQRIGRTGRKKDGVVHVLLAAGREDKNWDKAKENYQHVQHFIVRAEQLELYDDVSRMLPDFCKPDCVEMVMDIEEYNREEATKKASARSPAKTTKRKRNNDVTRNIPTGAATSFVSVKDLLVKGTKKKARPDFDPSACEDDDDDLDLIDGLTAPSRTKSLTTTSKSVKGKKPRRAYTIAGPGAGKKKPTKLRKIKTGSLATSEMSASQLAKLVEDDSDDKEIEGGFFSQDTFVPLKPTNSNNPITPSSSTIRRKRKGSPSCCRSSSPEIALHSVIDLTTPDVRPSFSLPKDLPSPPSRSPSISRIPAVVNKLSHRHSRSPSVHRRTSVGAEPDTSLAWLVANDDEPEIQFSGSSPTSTRASSLKILTQLNDNDHDSSIEFVENFSPPSPSVMPRALNGPQSSQEDMPPPALPSRFTVQSPEMPPSTFAVRAPGNKLRKRPILEIGSSPLLHDEPATKRSRVRRRPNSPSPIPSPQFRKKRRVFKDAAEAQKHNPWVDFEAEHSGDERSVGSSGAEDDMDEYDASFVQDMPETQALPSYDQSAVYRQSLLSQIPGGATSGPLFANKPARRGHSLRVASSSSYSRRRPVVSSSPRRTDEEFDDYVVGSFVVEDDDEEISYRGQSSDL